MPPTMKLAAIALDCADPNGLAEFYRDLLGLEIRHTGDGFVALAGATIWLTLHRVDSYQRPTWPGPAIGKQAHIDIAVEDLDAAQAHAVSVGSTVAELQPEPELWRVLIDPAGHPFCLVNAYPENTDPTAPTLGP